VATSGDASSSRICLPEFQHHIGKCVILPSSYLGGPRDLHQCYLDGMAIAWHFRKIDIFLMMTANPNWPKIKQALLPGQTVID
jgi:Helitron helicase-like domain at N-terminus